MYKRKASRSNTNPQDDPDESRKEYNECVMEVKHEKGVLGSLALHQEAMKRLSQRKSDTKKKEVLAKKPDKLKKQSSFDAVARLFNGILDDDDSVDNKSTSLESMLFADEIDAPPPSRQTGARGHTNRSSKNRVSLNSLSALFRDSVSMRSLISSTDANRDNPILRRQSSIISKLDFDDAGSSTMMQDLELSDSDDDSIQEDRPTRRGISRNGSIRASFRRGSGALRGSITRRGSVKNLNFNLSKSRRRSSGFSADSDVTPSECFTSSDAPLNSGVSGARPRYIEPNTALRGSFTRRGSEKNLNFNLRKHSRRRSSGFSASSDGSTDASLKTGVSGAQPRCIEPKTSLRGSFTRRGRRSSGFSASSDGSTDASLNADVSGASDSDDVASGVKITGMDRPGLTRIASRRGARRSSLLRSSLISVDEDFALNAENLEEIDHALDASIAGSSLDNSFNDGSLICGWGRTSLTSLGSFGEDINKGDKKTEDGAKLICHWGNDSQLSTESAWRVEVDTPARAPTCINQTKVQVDAVTRKRFSGFDFASELTRRDS